MKDDTKPSDATQATLADLPLDELSVYAQDLGLAFDPDAAQGELLRLIRERQELLLTLNREALLDIVMWARLPVRRSAGKEALARQISTIARTRHEGLSHRGLIALARLNGLEASDSDSRSVIERRLRRQGGLWSRIRRKRRAVVGSMLGRLLDGGGERGTYHFLPEEGGGESLKDTVRDVGVVEGIAQKLRGAADQYIEQKLDEIERRIDTKLDEIDRRLGEWRDQEIKNRLRIIKITLISAIVVAALSLGYDYLKTRDASPGFRAPADVQSTLKDTTK